MITEEMDKPQEMEPEQPRRSKKTVIVLLLLAMALMVLFQSTEKPTAATPGPAAARPKAQTPVSVPVIAAATQKTPSGKEADSPAIAVAGRPRQASPPAGEFVVGMFAESVVASPIVPLIPSRRPGKVAVVQTPSPKPRASTKHTGGTRATVGHPAPPLDKPPKIVGPGIGNAVAGHTNRPHSPPYTSFSRGNGRAGSSAGRMPDSFFRWGPGLPMGGGFTGGHFGGMGGGHMGGGHMGGHMGGGHR